MAGGQNKRPGNMLKKKVFFLERNFHPHGHYTYFKLKFSSQNTESRRTSTTEMISI
jgi:hypothetical protein